jgi:2'-5' RNA ligase
MKNTKRLFIAVKPPENVVESLKRIIGFYKKESWEKMSGG